MKSQPTLADRQARMRAQPIPGDRILLRQTRRVIQIFEVQSMRLDRTARRALENTLGMMERRLALRVQRPASNRAGRRSTSSSSSRNCA